MVRNSRINVPVTHEEREMVHSLAEPLGIPAAQFIRDMVRKAYEKERAKKTKAA
jgi:hypothetical protein